MALWGDELAQAIDIFDDQSKILDSSGKGDLNAFQENLGTFHLDPLQVRLFKGSSEDVDHGYIIQQADPVRFISVDGGYGSSIVQNDLRLAEKIVASCGVIALDDYRRAVWPDVTAGYTLWWEKTDSDIIPFACGSNKLFLCREDFTGAYRAALTTPFLVHFYSSSYSSGNAVIDSYRVDLIEQDEARMKNVIALMFKISRPEMFVALKTRMRCNPNCSHSNGLHLGITKPYKRMRIPQRFIPAFDGRRQADLVSLKGDDRQSLVNR